MLDLVTRSVYKSGAEFLRIPNFPYQIGISPKSHFHSHNGEELLGVIVNGLFSLPKEKRREILLKKPDYVRLKFELPKGVELKNGLVRTTKDSAIFYARRLVNIIEGEPNYRRGYSRLILNGTPTLATHIFLVLAKEIRPKSGEIVYKIVTAYPTGKENVPPEKWDINRINELGLNFLVVENFWSNHAISVNINDHGIILDSNSFIFPKETKDLVITILKGAGKL